MTTAESYYDLIKEAGSGQLFYLKHQKDSEYVFDAVIIDTTKETESINRLRRVMMDPKFIAFPGTPEFDAFIEEVDNSENKQ